jgi:fructokinase
VENTSPDNLSIQDEPAPQVLPARTLVVGEVLWDVLPGAIRLGGAPLNFAVHLRSLGHAPRIVSAVGQDALGETASADIRSLGLDTTFLQSSDHFGTGTASVTIGPRDGPSFTIERPAAYDAVQVTDALLAQIVEWKPSWCYYGTLFPSRANGRHVLRRLVDALPDARCFYDVNLRPGSESRELTCDLLHQADVVKLNEREWIQVRGWLGLPADLEGFCRVGAERFGWQAACVTLGARGCAMLVGDDFAEAPGVPVAAADTVGAGDAFAAAFLHGVIAGWPVPTIAECANRAGAAVVSARGAAPDR